MTAPPVPPVAIPPAPVPPGTGWRVQGMGRGKVPPDWPPISAGEAARVLRHFGVEGCGPVLWRSPRPFSAAALVATTTGPPLFIKRHHRSVRDGAVLAAEHAFARHLLQAGVVVPRVLATRAGATVVGEEEWCYEVHTAAPGVDAYRDALSWEPYRHPAHGAAAGAALGRLHRAAAGFDAPGLASGVLRPTDELARAADPAAALERVVARRRGLAVTLARWPWREEVAATVLPGLAAAARRLAGVPSQWTHGDWHPSNLTWSAEGPAARVVAVLDLGLANRTSALHDLAVALERTAVGWLDLAEGRPAAVDLEGATALVAGYASERPLTGEEAATVAALLPVVHVDFALSEIEYFGTVTRSADNAALAYRGYLIGHADWFARSPDAAALVDAVRRAAV